MSATLPPILERDAEAESFRWLAREAARRESGLVLLEGPAGIGKTVLLGVAREAAREQEFVVLSATGSELDRDFPFGLVHQLLGGVLASADDERRARLLTGAAAFAELVLAPKDLETAADPSHAALHGLYWLCANLADEQPLALVVDDLHWGDQASLRFLEFLGRRLEGLPLLVVGAIRTGEGETGSDLLTALAAGPVARTVQLRPLSRDGVARSLAEGLGRDPEEPFVAACVEVTGGNPLLLRELVHAAAEQGLSGGAAEVDAVTEAGAAGIAGATQRRLSGLGAEAAAVARAVTVLGDAPRLDDLATLTDLDELAVQEAADRLVGAQVLLPETLGFVHPLVRSALAATLRPRERSRLHGIAAHRLAEREAPSGAVARHLLATSPAADPWVVGVLRDAARQAGAEGASDAATAYLLRALDEPPPADERARLLLALGERQIGAGDPTGRQTLLAALRAGLTGDEAARARASLAQVFLLIDPPEALAQVRAAREEVRDAALAERLEALALEASFYDARLAGDRSELLGGDAPEDLDGAAPARLAHVAIDAAYHARDVDTVGRPARAAIADGALVRSLGPASATMNVLALALRHAEQPGLAASLLDGAQAEARRRGSLVSHFYIGHARAYWHMVYGTLTAAEAHAREAMAIVAAQATSLGASAVAAILAEILLERGALEEADAILARHPLPEGADRSVGAPDWLSARAAVRIARRRPDEALDDLRLATTRLRDRGWVVPLKGRSALRLAELLAARGERDEAQALVDEELDASRRRGARGTAGLVLRTAARVAGDDERALALLAESETELRASELRLDLSWTLHDRGAALRRAGSRAEARELLREALDVAGRLGATTVAARTRDELAAAGSRARTDAVSGPEALTPSERRVAELAAQGLSNREVAETLWVTRKTVELHLGRAYAKLGIRSRKQLADALGG